MHTIARRLAGNIQMRHRGRRIPIDPNATHEVVLRGHHRNRLLEDVAPLLLAVGSDVGKVRAYDLAINGIKAQPLVLRVLIAHLVLNGARHHVPGLQLVGKALAGLVEQNRSLATATL